MWIENSTTKGPKPDITAQIAEGEYHHVLGRLSSRGALLASVSHAALFSVGGV